MYKLEDDIIIIKNLRKVSCSENNQSSSKETSRELKVRHKRLLIFIVVVVILFFSFLFLFSMHILFKKKLSFLN